MSKDDEKTAKKPILDALKMDSASENIWLVPQIAILMRKTIA
jgi:hypothetical protein